MSEPVTHAEIEDVLSSIRRLVSEDGRDSPLPSKPTPKVKAVPRLVLTPSLRVTDEPVTTSDQSENADSTLAAEKMAEDFLAATMVVEDRVDEYSQAVQPEVPPSISLEIEQPDTTPDVQLSAAPENKQADIGQTDGEPNDALAAESPSVEPEAQGDDTIVQIADQPDEGERAEPTITTDNAQDETPGDAPWQNPDATLFAAAGVTETPLEVEAEAEPSDDAKPSASFAEKIAALEAVIGQADEQWEPDGESNEANAGTSVETLAWEDLEEELVDVAPFASAETEEHLDDDPQVATTSEVTPEFEQPNSDHAEADILDATLLAEQAVADEVLGGIAADEAVMDEESLRELVTDIVREELQGALGERITRNVRKLVRREIHRALAVQDLG